jgi:RNA polymerase sigma factor for flagellar operon FliA
MTAEQTYLEHLQTIERIAAFVARRNHLNPDEAGEFKQEVCVRLLEDEYGIIRKYESRSSFSTYLTTVIMRLYQQWRTEQWGKWRPSAEARRLGDKAITLERLLTRDGYSFTEAVNVLTTPSSSSYTLAELEAIYIRLPPRNPRPTLVSDDAAPDMVAVDADAEDRVEVHDRERANRKVGAAVDRLLESMDPEDRLILQLRFWKALKVPEIARRLHMEQKKIYKRLDRIFLMMRHALEEAGVEKADIAMLLRSGDQEIRFAFLIGEIGPDGPSNDRGGNTEGGEGQL